MSMESHSSSFSITMQPSEKEMQKDRYESTNVKNKKLLTTDDSSESVELGQLKKSKHLEETDAHVHPMPT